MSRPQALNFQNDQFRLIFHNCEHPITGGLVKDTVHCVLPSIPPAATFILTFALQLPLLLSLWKKRGDSVHFLRAVILCNFSSYIFGW